MKHLKWLPILLLALSLFLVACDAEEYSEEEYTDLQEYVIEEYVEDVVEDIVDDSDEEYDYDEDYEDYPVDEEYESVSGFVHPPLDSHVTQALTSSEMRQFEQENAVSAEQERYLAFGAFVPANNRESIRVLALGDSGPHATRILRDSWSITDSEGALAQIYRLSTATGQSPIADEIYRYFVLNNQLDEVDGIMLFLSGFDISRFENLFNNSVSRAEQMDAELDMLMEFLELDENDREEAFELLVYLQFAERVNRGLNAYVGARDMLITFLGFTEEELLNLPTLAAWDYGRVAIIARYGVEAGFLSEDEAWTYLKAAADSASEIYSSWREYTAAHILGRALAFGNSSDDFRHMLNFLLHHPESSFQTIEFRAN